MGITLKNNHEQFKVVFGAHVNLLWASGIFRLDGCNIIVGVLQESSAIDFMTIQIYHINRMMISSNIKTSYTAAPSVTCRTWQRKQKQEKVHVKKSEHETGLRLVRMDMYIISGGTLFSVHFVRSYLQKMHGVSSADPRVKEQIMGKIKSFSAFFAELHYVCSKRRRRQKKSLQNSLLR